MKIKALICDVDGTLLNTVELIRRGQYEGAVRQIAEVAPDDVPSYETYQQALDKVNGGALLPVLMATSKVLFGEHSEIYTKLDFERMAQSVRDVQDEIAHEVTTAYDGLPQLLQQLSHEGIKFGIFTSGIKKNVIRNFGVGLPEIKGESLRHHVDVDEAFELLTRRIKDTFELKDIVIVTADHVKNHKPAPDSLLQAMQALGAEPEETAALGDHSVDMQAATAAGTSIRIGVTHGLDDETSLRAAGATHIVHHLNDVATFLV